MISPEQIRAARAMLDWSTADLAKLTGLTANGINKIERNHVLPQETTLKNIQAILERYGIEFIPGGGLKKKENIITILKGDEANRDLARDVYETLKDTGGELLIAYADEDMTTTNLGEEFMREQLKRRADANITHRFLCCQKDYSHMAEIPASSYKSAISISSYRPIPEHYFSDCSIFIYGPKLALLKADTPQEVIIINDERFTESARYLFDFAWEIAGNTPREHRK